MEAINGFAMPAAKLPQGNKSNVEGSASIPLTKTFEEVQAQTGKEQAQRHPQSSSVESREVANEEVQEEVEETLDEGLKQLLLQTMMPLHPTTHLIRNSEAEAELLQGQNAVTLQNLEVKVINPSVQGSEQALNPVILQNSEEAVIDTVAVVEQPPRQEQQMTSTLLEALHSPKEAKQSHATFAASQKIEAMKLQNEEEAVMEVMVEGEMSEGLFQKPTEKHQLLHAQHFQKQRVQNVEEQVSYLQPQAGEIEASSPLSIESERVEPVPVTQQLEQALIKQPLTKEGMLVVKLSPEGLGELIVKLEKSKEGKLHLRILADDEKVAMMLNMGKQELKQTLSVQQMSEVHVEIQYQSNQPDSSHSQSQTRHPHHQHESYEQSEEVIHEFVDESVLAYV